MSTTDIKVICLESEAFYKLVDEVIQKLKSENNQNSKEQWIDDAEAMQLLKIGKTTLSKYRSEGFIRYSQIGKKVILYDRFSIIEFIENNVKESF